MAYATNFQTLHLKLSRKIQDPVSSIATDGQKVSAALRSDYLNRANKYLQLFFMGYDKDPVRTLTQKYLSGIVKAQSFTFATAGTALASDFSFELACEYYVSASSRYTLPWIEPSANFDMLEQRKPFTKDAYTILGGRIYGYYNNALLTTGTGYYYYVATDQSSEADAATDININAIWYDTLVDLAASYWFEDKGDLAFSEANKRRTELVLAVISGANFKA